MEKIGLNALLAPVPAEDFLATHWPDRPLAVHGLGTSVRAVTSLPPLASLDALLRTWPGQVKAHLPDVSDESSAVSATPDDARRLFTNKMSLLFNNVEKFMPELAEWLTGLRADLGLPRSTYARCMIYATPHGRGTAAHFDQNANFVLQLHGTKKWRIAPNRHVEHPTQRFTIGQRLDPELAAYADREMPGTMPEPSEEIVLRPGSMLFLPRGYWHQTEAEGDALALNFTFSQPTWIDVFTLALRSRLSLSPDWRALADGVTSTDADRRARAELHLDHLLLELVDDLPNWQAADILAATEGESLELTR